MQLTIADWTHSTEDYNLRETQHVTYLIKFFKI